MSEPLYGNCLVAQSGGPSATSNASLAGVVAEALNHGEIEEIYGGLHGIQGILQEDLIDLAAESQQNIRGLRTTPGAALGSCRYQLKRATDIERALRVFEAHNIRFFFYIGGNDSMETALQIDTAAKEKGYDLRVIGIPKAVDNDIVATDHCPGYGSTAKQVATAVRELALDADAMGFADLVVILETNGRNAGWVAAASTLARRRDKPSDPPHLVYVPEVPFDPTRFLGDVQEVLKQERFCLVVVGEGLVDKDGNYLVAGERTDSFGHATLGGVGDYLRDLVTQSLGYRARSIRLGSLLRSSGLTASKVDNDEAFLAGEAAVRAAVQGATGKMVTLVRGESEVYSVETGLSDLSGIVDQVKQLPPAWLNEDGFSINFQFTKYALPLIQGEVSVPWENGTPRYIRLNKVRLARELEPFLAD